MQTRRPRSFSRRPMLEAVSPLPRLEATPPVTKRWRVETGRPANACVAKSAPVVSADGDRAGPRGLRITGKAACDLHGHGAGWPGAGKMTAVERFWVTLPSTPAGVQRDG